MAAWHRNGPSEPRICHRNLSSGNSGAGCRGAGGGRPRIRTSIEFSRCCRWLTSRRPGATGRQGTPQILWLVVWWVIGAIAENTQ